MFITDKEKLKKYEAKNRIWQGIPSIEVTEKGRIFVTFYSGGRTEEIGNYVVLLRSDDNGDTFTEPIAACELPDHRCFDPCLWIDPLKRLWLTFAVCPDDALYGVICDDPDAEELKWGEPFLIGHNVMMNKPIVTGDGRWLFPIAVWNNGVRAINEKYDSSIAEKGSFVYETRDEGKSFTKLGTPDVDKRHFDEHMLLEKADGTIRCFVRTYYGIGAADSQDGGRTFGEDFDSCIGGPDSRFHIRRLASGRVLLINHWHFKGRNNLYAMLSEDDGESFPYRLLLDERRDISYPDAKELTDGRIYICYDRDRGGYKETLEEALACEREVLTACVTEEDILAGKLVSEASYLKKIANKLQ